jgi:hypothetical protein
VQSLIHMLLLSSAIAIPQALAQTHTTSSSRQPQPLLTTANEGTVDQRQIQTLQRPMLEEEAKSSCSVRFPEPVPASSTSNKTTEVTGDPTPSRPLSPACKFHLVLQQTYSPYTFASPAFHSTWDQAEGRWPHYGGGVQGWGKRFGASLADTQSRRFIQGFALSTVLHQDPRYFPSYKQAKISRAWYAATRVLVVRKDDGDPAFNTSEFLGALLASAVQNSYYPRHDRTFPDTMNRYGAALGSDTLSNLLREFTPDIKRFFRKHAPKKIQRIEERLPIPADDKP